MPTEKRQRQKEGQRARREAAIAAARRRQRTRRLITFAVIAVVVVGSLSLASLIGGGDTKPKAAASTSTTVAPTTTSTSKTNPADKPKIEVPSAPAPTTLETKDLTVGTGKEAKLGDTIEVNYVGVTYSDGKEFDASWNGGQSLVFPLREGGLIEGWVKGIPGMKVGGRRQLTIPSAMAYGDNPTAGRPAGALIFIVDLVSIQ